MKNKTVILMLVSLLAVLGKVNAQSIGQFEFRKVADGGGRTLKFVTPENNKAFGLNSSGDPAMLSISGGSSTFAGLSDVALTSITNSDLLRYDSGSSKWVNVAGSTYALASSLGALATLSTVASAQITDGTIVNDDVASNAAIAVSKLAPLTADTFVFVNGVGVLTPLVGEGVMQRTPLGFTLLSTSLGGGNGADSGKLAIFQEDGSINASNALTAIGVSDNQDRLSVDGSSGRLHWTDHAGADFDLIFPQGTTNSGHYLLPEFPVHGTTDTVAFLAATQSLTNKTISGSSNTITNLSASNLSSGTVATARLGTGTADSTTYLRGDGTWSTVSGGVTSVTGTANEITVTGTTTPTLSLPAALTFTGKTVTGGTFSSPTLTAPVLGTPSSGTVTNLTGTASININGTVGATTPTTGAFTTLSATGAATVPRIIGSQATGTLQLGDADAASPVAQTLQVQSVASGTSNTAGVDWSLSGSASTGTGTAGNILVKTSSLGKGASSSTVTITIATPGVVSWASHGLLIGQPVVFTTTGALPTGLVSGSTYYVCRSTALTANAFAVSSTAALADAGTAITTSGSQSGTHTATTSATDQNPPTTLLTLGPANLIGSQTATPLTLAQTWNTSGTEVGVKLIFKDIGSSITSSYFSIYGGAAGTTKLFSVEKVGGANSVRAGSLVSTNNTWSFDWDVSGLSLGSARQVGWSSTLNSYDAQDLILVRDAAGTLAQKNSTNAQTLRIYGTTTGSKYLSLAHDGTNGVISASSGAVTMGITLAVKSYTVATLPSTAATGMVTGAMAYVTDATAPTYLGTLTGGGAVVCPVFYNGSAWVSH